MKEKVIKDIILFLKKDIINDLEIELSENDNIIERGLIDSMGIVMLMTYIVDIYEIKSLDHTDIILDNFNTVEDISEMVLKYIKLNGMVG